MSFMNKVKFYLGMVCIVQYGEKFVITKGGLLRTCLDRRDSFWWSEGSWNRFCTFNTKEEAEARLAKFQALAIGPPRLSMKA